MKYFICLLVVFYFLFPDLLNAQGEALSRKQDHHKKIQEEITLRIPQEESLKKYLDDPSFNYEPNAEEVKTWFDRLMDWINKQLQSFRYSSAYSIVTDYLAYIIMFAAIIIIILGLLKTDIKGLFFGKKPSAISGISGYEEDINKLDFENLITSSLNNKNYKLAVRYYYLSLLKMLSDKNIIEVSKNKTNRQYASDIKSSELKNNFILATGKFELAWYGNILVDEKMYLESENIFKKVRSIAGKQS